MAKARGSDAAGLEKSDIVGWRGGLDIDLSRVDSSGLTLEERLSKHVKEELDREVENQAKLIENVRRWQNQYKGKKGPKSVPFPNCANIAVPMTRINVDTVFTRIVDGIFNRRRPVIVKAKRKEFMDLARQVEDALDWLLTNVIKLREKLLSPLLQQLKVGTGILYLTWETQNRTIYRDANAIEAADPTVRKYSVGSTKVVKDVQTIYSGPNIYPVPRENFIVSSDATGVDDAYLIGFRKEYRKYEVETNVRNKMWRKATLDKLGSPDAYTENEETRAENQGRELKKTTFSAPYEFYTLWLKYDVDDDGEPDDIMVTIHRPSGLLARAIYTPTFTGQRPFVKLVGYPTEYAFDGEGYCEVLFNPQEELDAIHNQRIDRMKMINSLMTISRAGSGLENFKVELGKNYVCDDNINDAFREIRFSDTYPSTQVEEAQLWNMADKVTGNTPALQGLSLAERPVYKDTQALLSESNKKFKMMIDNIIYGITETIYQLLELYGQYEPNITYRVAGADGKMEDRSITLPIKAIRDGLDIKLAASSDTMSQEARRELNQLLYTMTSDYMTKTASMAQVLTNPQVPVEFKKFLLQAGRASARLFRDILLDADRQDASDLAINPADSMDMQAILAPPPPPDPPAQGPMGGPPGMGMPPDMPGPEMGGMGMSDGPMMIEPGDDGGGDGQAMPMWG